MVFHVLNRGVGRRKLFRTDRDYQAFENVLIETLALRPMRLCAYCLMPNHWHMVLWPRRDGELAAFMQRLTTTHVRRWQEFRKIAGTGHVYQGRYKSFPIEQDEHCLTALRYVERNALRADLVDRAELWPWCSLYRWRYGNDKAKSILSPWPVDRPRQWLQWVNRPRTDAELEALRQCVGRNRPYGSADWQRRTAARLGLQSTFRAVGRPSAHS